MKTKILFVVFVPPLLLFALAFALILLPLPEPFPEAMTDERNSLAAITIGVLGFAYLIGVVLYALCSYRQTTRKLDSIFLPLGMQTSGYQSAGKKYTGTLENHEVEIVYVPASSLARMLLLITVKADLPTALILTKGELLGIPKDMQEIDVNEIDIGEFSLFASDKNKVSKLLAGDEIKSSLARLTASPPAANLKEISLRPDGILLRARPQAVSKEQIRAWLDDLLVISRE